MVTINIGRKEAVFLGAIILIFLVVGLGVAYGGNQPEVMGHSLGEISGAISGTVEQYIDSSDATPKACKFAWGTASCNEGFEPVCDQGNTLRIILMGDDTVNSQEIPGGCYNDLCHFNLIACIKD